MTDPRVAGRARDRRAFAAAALALTVLFAGNNLPSALYGPSGPRSATARLRSSGAVSELATRTSYLDHGEPVIGPVGLNLRKEAAMRTSSELWARVQSAEEDTGLGR